MDDNSEITFPYNNPCFYALKSQQRLSKLLGKVVTVCPASSHIIQGITFPLPPHQVKKMSQFSNWQRSRERPSPLWSVNGTNTNLPPPSPPPYAPVCVLIPIIPYILVELTCLLQVWCIWFVIHTLSLLSSQQHQRKTQRFSYIYAICKGEWIFRMGLLSVVGWLVGWLVCLS